jgi:cyclohexa-1,5-dienecarbonyl-CoA hydratase
MKWIGVQESRGVVTIRLSRPPLNVIHHAMILEVIETLRSVEARAKARVVVFRGAGRCFSAGVDVKEHLPDAIPTTLRAYHEMVGLMRRLPIPTLSAVHGVALGGGFELVLASDLAIARQDATFGTPEITLGVFAPVAVVVLRRRIGDKRANEMLMAGRVLDSREALDAGLVSSVHPELDGPIQAITRKLCSLSRPALALCKRVIQATEDDPVAVGIRRSEEIYLRELASLEDMVEGMNAFLEKRTPRWKHR